MGKAKNIVILGATIVVIIVIFYSLRSTLVDYQTSILNERNDKDTYMRGDPDSPLSESLKDQFAGLSYYPVNEKYKVNARLVKFEEQVRVNMATNDGKEQHYQKYAYARFEIDGQNHQLLLIQPYPIEDDSQLFLAFGDATSGDQTYGGGRYLDLEIPSNEELLLDFNLAYNPFCSYSDAYSCPLPPAENLLDISISAGEKNFISP